MINNNVWSLMLYYIQMILLWILAYLFFLFLRNFGGVATIPEQIGSIQLGQIVQVNVLVGILTGLTYTTIELLFERQYFHRFSFGQIILGKLMVFFLVVKMIMAFGLMLVTGMTAYPLGWKEVVNVLRSEAYWVVFVYFLVVAALISFVRMVNQKFGPGILWNMLIGKYRKPREEQRIFMFLDLKSSTSIAEKLGHIAFSRLIQECFADLTPVVNQNKAEIYQYVGDEAVLSWPLENGLKNNNCIHTFFNYLDALANKSAYYQKEYGVQPVFKAGVHLGTITVAEVGIVKREIAYHGDVL